MFLRQRFGLRRTPLGLYQWRLLRFGMTNAPAAFQAVMNRCGIRHLQVLKKFRPYIEKIVLVYLK